MTFPNYNREQSYDWNYKNVPAAVCLEIKDIPGTFDFCGLPVRSPLGMPAGPLLNGRWCLYYASLGFDVVTYKTVRNVQRDCYPLPNLVPVMTADLFGGEGTVPADHHMNGSWAVSYGMPSQNPDVWQADIADTRRQLPPDKVLSVSVVGTVQPDWTLEQLAEDYALCAKLAIESGADCVEANFSCPNVSTCDGQLYQNPMDCGLVVQTIRQAIGDIPLIGKIGRLQDAQESQRLVEQLHPYVDALAMTNSIATRVRHDDGELMFQGEQRGICGKATLEASVDQTQQMSSIIDEHGFQVQLIGVGGVSCVEDVHRYMEAGAHAVHIATAAMTNPEVALEIRNQW